MTTMLMESNSGLSESGGAWRHFPPPPHIRKISLTYLNQVGHIMPTVLLRASRIFRPSYGPDGFIMNVAHRRHFPSYHEAWSATALLKAKVRKSQKQSYLFLYSKYSKKRTDIGH